MRVQSQCMYVVIGVVIGELLVVRVVPIVCDDAVVRRTLVLIAFTVAIVFFVAILRRILLCWSYGVFRFTAKGLRVFVVLVNTRRCAVLQAVSTLSSARTNLSPVTQHKCSILGIQT